MSRDIVIGVEDDGIRLDRWFRRHMPEASFNQVSRWARTGQLRLDGKRAKPGDRIAHGQLLRVPPLDPEPSTARARPTRREPSAEELELARSLVIHQDASALVLNKPPGFAVQGGTRTPVHVDGLLDALRFDARERPRLVHRLDKDTSGVLLVARTARAAAFFGKCFATRDTRKIYWAMLMGEVRGEAQRIELALAKEPGTGGEKMAVVRDGQAAVTDLAVLDRAGNRCTFVELRPRTGRTHQLRVHAAAIGNPILGDGKYGGRDAFLTGGVSRKMHLHARRLVIAHPDGGKLDVTAPLPEHFAATIETLGLEPPQT
jgi:23S rRNA pseudouridine955/2504/2580 synthase